MRLIDADKLIELFTPYISEDKKVVYQPRSLKIDDIKNAPTINAVPVRHGKWIYKGIRGRFPACACSECGNVENADWAILGDNVNYCPNCGAKMDGERREDADSN